MGDRSQVLLAWVIGHKCVMFMVITQEALKCNLIYKK